MHRKPPTTIYTLSLHDALPISAGPVVLSPKSKPVKKLLEESSGEDIPAEYFPLAREVFFYERITKDRKSTRLNSSHVAISYAVFCLKKKKKTTANAYNSGI